MTSLALSTKMALERRFFFYMAVVIFFTVLAGFGSQLLARCAWFTDFPWQVHVHAVVFSSWIIIYVLQNWLVVDGRAVGLHRRLGWAGAGVAVAMVPLGLAATLMAIARGSITGIFPSGLFLALDTLHILGFGVLTGAALRLHDHPAWHKRLMLCGTVLATAPALSRLCGFLPLGGLTPLAVVGSLLLFIVAGLISDLVIWHRIHPAYWWGAGTMTVVELLVTPIGFSSPVVSFAAELAR